MARIIDDWGLRYPGVKNVEQETYLYGARSPTRSAAPGSTGGARQLGRDLALRRRESGRRAVAAAWTGAMTRFLAYVDAVPGRLYPLVGDAA